MAAPSTGRPTHTDAETRRGMWIAAGVMVGVIAVLMVVFVAFYPDDGTGDAPPTTQAGPQDPPSIIPKPGEGVAPDDPGDPGGWQQLALFGIILVGMASVAAMVWRSSRRARRRGPTST